KHASLVEFRNHEFVKLSGGLQLFIDERLIIADADSRGTYTINPRIKCIADEFDGILGAFSQVHDVEPQAIEAPGPARQTPARPETFVAFERTVHVSQQ